MLPQDAPRAQLTRDPTYLLFNVEKGIFFFYFKLVIIFGRTLFRKKIVIAKIVL